MIKVRLIRSYSIVMSSGGCRTNMICKLTRRSTEVSVSPKKVVGCRGGSRNVEECWGFPYLKIQKLSIVHFMFFDRYEIHIQDFEDVFRVIVIISRCPSSQHLIKNEIPDSRFPNYYFFIVLCISNCRMCNFFGFSHFQSSTVIVPMMELPILKL